MLSTHLPLPPPTIITHSPSFRSDLSPLGGIEMATSIYPPWTIVERHVKQHFLERRYIICSSRLRMKIIRT